MERFRLPRLRVPIDDRPDQASRTDLLRQANNLLYEDAPVWFFNYNKAVLAYQPWIHGLQANPTEITHQYPEDIWVDAKSPAK